MGARTGRTLVGLAVAICGLAGVGAAADPASEFPFATPGPLRDAYMQAMIDGCFRNQRADPTNSTESDADLEKYCRCIAEAVAGHTTREDIEYRKKNHAVSPATADWVMQAARACAQDIIR